MRVYISHPIRGQKGSEATEQDMVDNCRVAALAAELMRANIDHKATQGTAYEFAGIAMGKHTVLYVPGEHDEFVRLAYLKGFLSESQILEIDCDIISGCDVVLAMGHISAGMKWEIEHAERLNIPIYYAEAAWHECFV